MSDQAYLELWDLTKSYPSPKGEAIIVKDVNFKFRKGEFVTVIGHSGCGKSTILMMVAGLSTITSGGIVLASRELKGPGPDRGVVFQAPSLLPWMTAFQNVMLGVDQVFYTAEARERALIANTTLRSSDLANPCTSFHLSFPKACGSASELRVRSLSHRRCSCSTSLLACLIRSRGMSSRRF